MRPIEAEAIPHATRAWEEEAPFGEVLAEQIHKAPYLLGSLALHAVVALMLAGWIFLQTEPEEAPLIQVAAPPPPPLVEEEPPPEEPVQEQIEEPVLREVQMEEAVEVEAVLEERGDPDFHSDSVFEDSMFQSDLGVGRGPGGDHGIRGTRWTGQKSAGSSTERAVRDGLQWLADHQSPEGFWDCDEFMYEDALPAEPPSDGPGNPVNDVGVTGLALLAFLGHGNTMDRGEYYAVVRRGVQWLRGQQRGDGLFGDEVGEPTLYNHSIATLAFAEAYGFSVRPPQLRRDLQRAVALILRARNPYGAWRYRLEPDGQSDTSVTGWMVFALKAADDAGIPVSHDAYDGTLSWLDQMTDPASGRTGYAMGAGGGPGGAPSRRIGDGQRFPVERSESLTAVALLCRLFLADSASLRRWEQHPRHELLQKQARLCLAVPPVWEPQGGSCDLYYWYYATFALNQWGGQAWRSWQASIEEALLPNQRRDGNFRGSWDPAGPWGEDGGRVYSTALCVLMLEVYYRYDFILGAR